MLPVWGLVLYMLVDIPSFILYLSMVFMILKHRKQKPYDSTFFKMLCIQGFFDCSAFIVNCYVYKFSKVQYFIDIYYSVVQPNLLTKIGYFLSFYFFYGQYYCSVMIVFNRLTAMIYLRGYEQLWGKLFVVPLLIIFVLPVATCWFILWSDVYFTDFESNDGYAVRYSKAIPGHSLSINSAIVSFVIIIVSLTANLATLGLLKYRLPGNGTKSAFKYERRLVMYTFAVFVPHLVCCAYEVYLYVIINNVDYIFMVGLMHHYLWISDLYSFCTPWLVLLTNSGVRNLLFKGVTESLTSRAAGSKGAIDVQTTLTPVTPVSVITPIN